MILSSEKPYNQQVINRYDIYFVSKSNVQIDSNVRTQNGGTGENTPFAVQSRKKERDNGHDTFYVFKLELGPNLFITGSKRVLTRCLIRLFLAQPHKQPSKQPRNQSCKLNSQLAKV